jgi:hypothetical protein
MKRTVLIIVTLLFENQLIFANNWLIIADSIASKQKKICDSVYYNKIDIYKDLRKRYSLRKHLDSTVVVGDTVIFMEYHHPFKLGTHCTMWVKGKPNSFLTYNKYNIHHRDITLCYWSSYCRKLCEEWNVSMIREEESKHPRSAQDYQKTYIMTTRVIIPSEDSFYVDTIFFEEFYLYPRDEF